jgi:hypothetical protein
MEKKCPKCDTIKSVDLFFKMKSTKSGYASLCKACCKIASKNYHDKKKGLIEINPISDNEYQTKVTTNFKMCIVCKINKMYKCFVALNNIMNRRDICRSCESQKRKKLESQTKHCPQCNTTYDKSNFPSDASRIDGLYGLCKKCKSIQDVEYKKNNPEKVKQINKKRMENPHERIAHNLRSRLSKFIKKEHTFDYVGLSHEEFRDWLLYQFDKNMNWDNYGSYWQIDHVVPCASFDLTKEEDIHKCNHWTNLRPLDKKTNNSKSSKILDNEINNHKIIVKKYKKLLKNNINKIEI